MNNYIRAGDLAIVIRPNHCCGNGRVGAIVRVLPDTDRLPAIRCVHCGLVEPHSAATTVRIHDGYIWRFRLKRIPPLAELEEVSQGDEVSA
jgi:hypothetical protein